MASDFWELPAYSPSDDRAPFPATHRSLQAELWWLNQGAEVLLLHLAGVAIASRL